MKKIILCFLFSLFFVPQVAFSNDNFIYSINVNRNNEAQNIQLDIKSDYKTKITNKIDEMGREYFDIKDASLKENFVIQYNNVQGVESVIAQQIGNKVRIYIKGDNTGEVIANFRNVENQPYPDKSAGYVLLVFGFIVFSVFRMFKKKAKRLNAKAQYLKNAASRAVYNNLMEKKIKSSATAHDNRHLTVNALNKRNIKSIGEYQKQRFIDRVAM